MPQIQYPVLAKQIIALKNADLKLRDQLIQTGQLSHGYNKEMADLHHKNAELLQDIMDRIGYPNIDKVGEEASEASWLIIQHSIGQPDFMRRCVRLLEQAVIDKKAEQKHLAYLTDRVAIFEGKAQQYGTQFDWNENGELSPQRYDDLSKVNQRRKSIGLNSLEEQTELMRIQAGKEQETAPANYEQRRKEYDEWRSSVGWI